MAPYVPSLGDLAGRKRNYQYIFGEFLRACGQVHLLSELPGNIGDHLIWRGTEKLLRNESIDFYRITVDEVRSGASNWPSGTLVVPGSGALTKKWHEWLPATIEVASKLFEKVVVLPSEYDTDVKEVAYALSQPNVFAFARDAESYTLIKRFGRAALGLDPALWAFDGFAASLKSAGSASNHATLLALRTDASSTLHLSGVQASARNNDLSASSASLQEFLDSIRRSETVVSDRLHVVVASLAMGKSVSYLDPWNEKISRYSRFNFRNEFDSRLRQVNVQWLIGRGYVE